ncbi:3-dehydroquinate synthase [bioreactor metagenome]|uniref:3-dehydroquinate synthase n=1 Tax=bioreactor metagenome TaxID=1076179 RepID=A0A644T0H4_9ZZZZ|nr:3-dehydroquinate synthase [Negativicutes bacterium]
MAELKVKLGSDSYDIHIGTNWISELANQFTQMKFSSNALIISDSNVAPLYSNKIAAVLNSVGFSTEHYSIDPGEQSKSATDAMDIYTKAIESKLDRKSPIVALGGGVVGDLAGFIAATYLRGVPFIQIPTTLLAQVDSSVGGKVAINHPLGKNLIGAFYQPELVFIDTLFLDTLPERELYTGLAEVLKYGVISDCDFFDYLRQNSNDILMKRPETIIKIIHRSCQIKADIVSTDERETGLRAILNFGHTIGHAIEAYTNFEKYNHGEAVAIGMHGAALISYHMGLCSAEVVEKICHCITKFHLPLKAAHCPADKILPLLVRDKKVINGKLNWVLIKDLGQVTIVNNVPDAIIAAALNEIT